MKNLKYALLIILATPFLANAAAPEGSADKKKKQDQIGLAAGCTPASRIVFLEFNNVRTRIEAGGLWWQDRANGSADYEVPVGSGSFALFAGGLWLAGTDVNGQLKAAASLFGSGVDFWSGPLDTTGIAEIDATTCDNYDRFFDISRQEVATFVAYRAAVAEGTASELFPEYQIPSSILDWPGNGDVTKGEDFNLAPYVNVGGDASYNPNDGDYPFYDLVGDVDCRAERKNRSESSTRPLFGDQTYWWIFNDKGNLHTETNAPSIGMEIHGQGFAFATNDAVNDMTFYNFELINRSTFTLTDTYFASYVDPDLGSPLDDYVGCDVNRGLGFCYNGDGVDEDFRGNIGYGTTPAAIGIDYFEGPYQDADGINNLVGIGPGEALNGLGYLDTNALITTRDSIPDNERFGMRRFVYYNNGTGNNGDPDLAVHFYNYMRGIWKNGRPMLFGGNGFNDGVQNLQTDFMFPGESDPLHWGTGGVTPSPDFDWTEDNPGVGAPPNDVGDRRFLQSAGPFTLEPGNVNDITVGVVFAQAESGGRLASVDKLFQADDKAQALFDNCFQVLNGPDAPDLDVQELDQELVFYLSNPQTSNNEEEKGDPYIEDDLDIVTPLFLSDQGIFYDQNYRFQGYQVYQLAGPGISVNDLEDLDKARLVFQCDIRDTVLDLINYTFDEELGANVPVKKVTASNEGIQRSFSVTEDLFAAAGSRLVNYKTYYYLAIAYGHNQYKEYAQDEAPDESNPFAPASDGQTMPYISSRRSATGGGIRPITGVPHDPVFENGGTVVNSSYGDDVQITRLQGFGNGGRELLPSQESIDRIFAQRAWEDPNQLIGEIDYATGFGPFDIKVIDPLNTIDGTFYMQFVEDAVDDSGNVVITDSAQWKIWLDGGGPNDTAYSDKTIAVESEQLLLNPNWGISISIVNGVVPGQNIEASNNGFISATVTFEDESNQWLMGIEDSDQEFPDNWIASGTFEQSQVLTCNDPTDVSCIGVYNDNENPSGDGFPDPEENFEGILNGIIAPYHLTRYLYNPDNPLGANAPANGKIDVDLSTLDKLNSFILVITNDKDKWSRCPVIETSETDADLKNSWKRRLSVDKEGRPVDTSGGFYPNLDSVDSQITSDDPNNPAYISSVGMGWFPGYVLNKETGERMNIAFGEDSEYPANGGTDMIWNPTSTRVRGAGAPNFIWGGKHFIYIFRKTLESERDIFVFNNRFAGDVDYSMPEYDEGAKLNAMLKDPEDRIVIKPKQYAWGSCSWVAVPILNPEVGQTLLSNDVRVDVNVSAPFGVSNSDLPPSLDNNGKPVYRFSTSGLQAVKNSTAVLKDELENLNVVPNPYYAISEYEATQLDNTVKFTNLPENCTITIYNTNGTLIRRYNKSDPLNYLDWNLKNQVGIPIASGVYLIHIEVPGVGEKILKWFGVVRPVDLNSF